MGYSKIPWVRWTWNPVWGCERECQTLDGVGYCYARRINKEHKRIDDFNKPQLMPAMTAPIPPGAKTVFVNSMSDVCFWKPEWLNMALRIIAQHPDKHFIFLTKDYSFYSSHLLDFDKANITLGLSATNKQQYELVVDAHYRLFYKLKMAKLLLNLEPILEQPLEDLARLKWDWVILGLLSLNGRAKAIPIEWIKPFIYEATNKNKSYPLFMKPELICVKGIEYPLLQMTPYACDNTVKTDNSTANPNAVNSEQMELVL